MKRDKQNELLKELLTGEEVSAFRRASLASGLAGVRRQRRYRRVARLGAVMALTLFVTVGIVHQRRNEKTTRQMTSVKPTEATSAMSPAPSAEAGKVKIITDEELFALFPGRSMALIGKPGEQQLVFLDGGSARAILR